MLYKAHRQQSDRWCPHSFTLVELLVVISIVALLLSILAPSLRSARERAREVVCAARLKQWGVAFHCYATENAAYWPHCDGLDREDPDPNNPDLIPPGAKPWTVANWHGWVDLLPTTIKHKPWRYFKKREHPKEDTFYQCPSGILRPDHSAYKKLSRNGYFSYAMNSCLELDEGTWRPPGGTDWPMPSFLNTARIVCPQRVIVLFDQLLDPAKGYGGWVPYATAGKHCGGYPIAFSARHPRSGSRLGGNLLFADAHVDWQKTVWKEEWGDWSVGEQQGPPRDDPNWYPYPAPRIEGIGH
jgi:prepilin-type processing-associated H-X9-DG protein